jgi:hypothetical protein
MMNEGELIRYCEVLPKNEHGCQIFDLFSGPKPRNKDKRKLTPVPRIILKNKLGRKIKPEYFACHHCDNPRCVNPEHIYEGTHRDNMDDKMKRDRARLGISNPLISLANRGENNHFAKATPQMVLEIRNLREQGFFYRELAEKFNLSFGCIRKICSNGTWNFLPHCTKIGRDYTRR